MTRYAKPLGLTVLAALLIVAVAAPSASALKEIRSAAAPRIITGALPAGKTFAFKVSVGEIKCTTANIEGTMTKTDQPSLKVTPVFSGCTEVLNGAKVDVTTTGCSFTYTYEEVVVETEPKQTHTPGPMHISCEGGNKIQLTPTIFGGSICTFEIPPQTPFEPQVDHKVLGTPSYVLITYTIEQLEYTVKGGGKTCGEEGVHKDGFFIGSQEAKGYESNAGKEGAQVAIWIS